MGIRTSFWQLLHLTLFFAYGCDYHQYFTCKTIHVQLINPSRIIAITVQFLKLCSRVCMYIYTHTRKINIPRILTKQLNFNTSPSHTMHWPLFNGLTNLWINSKAGTKTFLLISSVGCEQWKSNKISE